jgi:hypothetical protein
MASNQNIFGEHLEKGLGGRSFKATFLLYLINILTLIPIGFWTVNTYGEDRALEFLPIIVGAIIAIEYGTHFILSRANSREVTRDLEQVALEDIHLRPFLLIDVLPRLASQAAYLRTGSAKFEEHSELVTLERERLPKTAILVSLRSAYQELIGLIELKNTAVIPSLKMVVFGKISLISFVNACVESFATFAYRRFTTEGRTATIQKRIDTIETILRLEEKLKEQGVETDVLKQAMWQSLGVMSYNLRTLHPDLKLKELLGEGEMSYDLIINKSSPNVSKPMPKEERKNLKQSANSHKRAKKSQKRKRKKNYPGRKH